MDPLRKKFEEVELNLSECPYNSMGEEASADCVEITKSFAIKFFNWTLSESGIDYAMKIETTEELVQIFRDNHYNK